MSRPANSSNSHSVYRRVLWYVLLKEQALSLNYSMWHCRCSLWTWPRLAFKLWSFIHFCTMWISLFLVVSPLRGAQHFLGLDGERRSLCFLWNLSLGYMREGVWLLSWHDRSVRGVGSQILLANMEVRAEAETNKHLREISHNRRPNSTKEETPALLQSSLTKFRCTLNGWWTEISQTIFFFQLRLR